jgi:hypothetical protein
MTLNRYASTTFGLLTGLIKIGSFNSLEPSAPLSPVRLAPTTPREISSRSASLSVRRALRRSSGAIPPLSANTR